MGRVRSQASILRRFVLLTLLPEVLRNATGWGHDRLRIKIGWENAALWVQNLDIEKWAHGDSIHSLIILANMLFRPNGLFGRYEISDFFIWLWRENPSSEAFSSPHWQDHLEPASLPRIAAENPDEWVVANTSASRT